MLTKKGFTLVEVMVVIIIVAILVAIAVPIMRSRVDSAKWSEGKAMAGTIAVALRVYATEKGGDGPYPPTAAGLGFGATDLEGKYFKQSNEPPAFSWETIYNSGTNTFTYTITIAKPPEITSPDSWSLDDTGSWTSVP